MTALWRRLHDYISRHLSVRELKSMVVQVWSCKHPKSKIYWYDIKVNVSQWFQRELYVSDVQCCLQELWLLTVCEINPAWVQHSPTNTVQCLKPMYWTTDSYLVTTAAATHMPFVLFLFHRMTFTYP